MTNAAKSGSFSIGGKVKVHRLGFGAMRITGDGVWGPPKDKAEAMATLQARAGTGRRFHRHRRRLWPGCFGKSAFARRFIPMTGF